MRDDGASAKTGTSWLLTAGGVVAVVVGLGVYMSFRPEVEPSDADLTALIAPDASVPETPLVDAPPQAADAGTDEPEKLADESVVPAVAPSVDEVRLEADGVAVIAGRAAPGSTVRVLVDGEEIASAVADASGAFAAVGFVAPGDRARVLSLLATGDGEALASLDEVILAPMVKAPPPQEAPAPALAQADVGAPDDGDTAPLPEAELAANETAAEQATSDPVPAGASEATAAPRSSDVARLEAAPATNEAAEVLPEAPASDPLVAEVVPGGPASDQPVAEVAPEVSESPAPIETAEAATPEADEAPGVAILRSTAEGVTLLQPSAPLAEQIELDTIGYSGLGEVQLSGRADLDAVEVRVYINNRTVVRLPVDPQGGWRGDLPDVDAGVYTLRVDAVDADGKVTSRIETPFQREAPEALAAAAAAQEGPVTAVTVQTGDTLWAIARDRYGEGVLFVKVFEANRSAIRDPDLIFPGQVFDLPDR